METAAMRKMTEDRKIRLEEIENGYEIFDYEAG